MAPRIYRLSETAPQPPELWHRLRAELDAQGSPAVRSEHEDGTVTFTADTWDLVLKSRVADALMSVFDHRQWTRAFRPVE